MKRRDKKLIKKIIRKTIKEFWNSLVQVLSTGLMAHEDFPDDDFQDTDVIDSVIVTGQEPPAQEIPDESGLDQMEDLGSK